MERKNVKSEPIILIADNTSDVNSGEVELFDLQNIDIKDNRRGKSEVLTEKFHNETQLEVKQTSEYGGNPYVQFDMGDEGESFIIGKEVVIKVNGQPKRGIVQEFDDGQGGTIKGFGNPYLFNSAMYQDNGLDYFAFYEGKNFISGHINNGDSTFTFQLNNNPVTAQVDDDGYWEYEIPQGTSVTSLANSFKNCSNLVDVDFTNFDSSSVTSALLAFQNCTNLENVTFPIGFCNNCTSFGGLFLDCTSIEDVDIRNIDTSNARDIDSMFSGCTALKNVDLRGIQTSGVEYFSYMFSDCTNLVSVLGINDIDVSNGDITEMFSGCESLESLDLSNWTTSIYAYDIFSGCTSLKTIDVSNLISQTATSIWGFFKNCNSLEFIDATNWNTLNVTYVGYYQDFVPNVGTITIKYKASQWNNDIISLYSNVNWVNVE